MPERLHLGQFGGEMANSGRKLGRNSSVVALLPYLPVIEAAIHADPARLLGPVEPTSASAAQFANQWKSE